MARTVLIVAIVVSLVAGFFVGFIARPQQFVSLDVSSARVDGSTCAVGGVIGADQEVQVTVRGGGDILTVTVYIDPGSCSYARTPV